MRPRPATRDPRPSRFDPSDEVFDGARQPHLLAARLREIVLGPAPRAGPLRSVWSSRMPLAGPPPCIPPYIGGETRAPGEVRVSWRRTAQTNPLLVGFCSHL